MKNLCFERIPSDGEFAVERACHHLLHGSIIVYPTDTIYGFGCDSKNEGAIRNLNLIKGRKGPLSVLSPSTSIATEWMDIDNIKKNKAKSMLGGRTTIICPVKSNVVSSMILGIESSLGIRVPDHKFCNSLSKAYNNPIITTSVNLSGVKPYSNPDEIEKKFGKNISLLIDEGEINGTSSEIYFLSNGEWEKLR